MNKTLDDLSLEQGKSENYEKNIQILKSELKELKAKGSQIVGPKVGEFMLEVFPMVKGRTEIETEIEVDENGKFRIKRKD